MSNFTPKRSAEIEIFAVDFANLMGDGEVILSAVWTNAVHAGRDALAGAMITGAAMISGTKVNQMIAAGVAGAVYAPTCTALTSAGQVLILPDPGTGLLTVTA